MSSPDKPDDGDQPPPSEHAGGQSEHPFSSASGASGVEVDTFYGVEQPPSRVRATMPAVDPTTIIDSVSPPDAGASPDSAASAAAAASPTSPLVPPASAGPQTSSFAPAAWGAPPTSQLAPPAAVAPPTRPFGSPTAANVLVDSDEPPLPLVQPNAELRDAVGPPKRAKARKVTAPADRDPSNDSDDEDGDSTATKWSRRTITIAALAIIVGLGVAALVFLGRANSQRYMIACTTDHVSAEHGRAFPPWGTKPLNGAAWKSIQLPPNAECRPRETEDIAELEGWYLDLIVDRASTTLSSPNLLDGTVTPGTPIVATNGKPLAAQNPLDAVAEQLNQALLLSRAPERRDQRKEVERLLGDVQYWRASLRLREASTALADASRQFDAAAAQRPRHVTDAAAWGAFLKKLSDELQAGPNGAPTAPAPVGPAPTDRPTAPAGVALPVEPTAPAEPSGSDTAPATPDAGVPSGGVLL